MKLLFPILSILICGALFFTVISPSYARVSQLKTDVATYNAALTNSTYLQNVQDELLDQYKNIKTDDKVRLEHFLPSAINNIEFILEIEQIANLHNMPIKDITFDAVKVAPKVAAPGAPIVATDPATNKVYGVFPLEFTTEGSYDSFESFLKDLEHNLRLMDIKSIAFEVPQPTKENPNPTTYTYKVKVETYWLK